MNELNIFLLGMQAAEIMFALYIGEQLRMLFKELLKANKTERTNEQSEPNERTNKKKRKN